MFTLASFSTIWQTDGSLQFFIASYVPDQELLFKTRCPKLFRKKISLGTDRLAIKQQLSHLLFVVLASLDH